MFFRCYTIQLLAENFVAYLCMHANAYSHQRCDKTNLYKAQAVLVIHYHNTNKMRTFSCFMLENMKNGLYPVKGLITFSCAHFFVFSLSCCMPVSVTLATAGEIPVDDSTHLLWCSHRIPVCCCARLVASKCTVYT